MTFVKARLALERIHPGETLVIRLNSGEPVENLPRSLGELGHRVLALTAEDPATPNGVHVLAVVRA